MARDRLAALWAWIVAIWRRGSTPVEPTDEDEYWDEHYWRAW